MKNTEEFFNKNAQGLSKKYDQMTFDEVHGSWAIGYPFEGKVILDVGCGNGRDSIYMASKGAKVIAIDFSKEFLKIARQRDSRKNVRWIYQVLPYIRDEEIINTRFDIILLSAVIMFLSTDEQDETLLILLGLLKKAGKCIITVKINEGDDMLNTITPNLENIAHQKNCKIDVFCGGSDLLGRSQTKWVRYILTMSH